MYKVVIVDDEEIIVEGLKTVVPWKKYDCEVVGTGYDAKSGAQAVRLHKPDILFTDIKMPNTDGLTMLAGLKGEFPNMQVAVLTGFRDFEYAKRAIQIGVTRFLLKPSKMDELEEALDAMTANLSANLPAPGRLAWAQGEEETAREPAKEAEANSFIVRSALRHIEAHYAEKLTLTELAEKTYVSQWYLSKLLNKATGKSFSELLNQQRIKKAEALLKDPSLKIREISDLLGFNDVTHFSKTFKKNRQLSPNEYRNSVCK